jgi:predicted dienelactone hydrolase
MNNEFARSVVMMLEKEKGHKFGKEALSKIKDDLMKESDKAAELAYDRMILHFSGLPSAAKFLEIVQEEGRKLKMAEAKKNEEVYERNKPKRGESTFLSREQQTEHGKRCKQIYDVACPVDSKGMPVNPEEDRLMMLIESCEVMAKAYPNEHESWNDLKAHFVNMGLKQREAA